MNSQLMHRNLRTQVSGIRRFKRLLRDMRWAAMHGKKPIQPFLKRGFHINTLRSLFWVRRAQ